MRKGIILLTALVMSVSLMADDHVMAATKSGERQKSKVESEALSLSLAEAQDFAVKQNRTLKNASLAVQEAYAQRWQTIASMLPQVDGSFGKTLVMDSTFKEQTIHFGGMSISMSPMTYGVTASWGLNGQAIVGAYLSTLAIEMQKLALEESEDALCASVKTSYASVLVLQDIVELMDSSLVNLERLEQMTQRSVDVGAAEQTAADQIRVRVNTIKDNINSQKRNVELSKASLKVLLDVPVSTELELTTPLDELLSGEAVMQLLSENYNKENNISYQLLQKNVEIAKTNVHMAGWAYGPTLSAYYQYSQQNPKTLMGAPHTVGLSVSMPLWSSGKRAAGLVEKKIALEEAKNTLAETTDNLDIQYQQLRYTLQNAYESYLTQKENLDVTRRVFESTTNKFNYGASSNLELVNASNDVISAQSSYVQAVLTLVQANVELDKFLNN